MIRNEHFLFQPLAITAIVALAVLLQTWIRTRLISFSQTHRLPSHLVIAIRACTRWIFIFIAAILCLNVLGIEIGNLWTLLSAILAVVGIGFVAVWSLLSNTFAFFVLIIWHHWRIGDRIRVFPENLEGRVIDMNLMFTRLKTDDGGSLLVPNSLFLQRFVKIEPNSQP